MKSITAIALLAIAGMVTTGKAFAQYHEVRATVPFDFTVGDKLLPAGNYSITPVSDAVILIRNRDRNVTLMTMALPDSRSSANRGKLVFDEAAGQYFLREILCGSAMSVDLPATKSEERAQRQEAMVPNASQVLVAAK